MTLMLDCTFGVLLCYLMITLSEKYFDKKKLEVLYKFLKKKIKNYC